MSQTVIENPVINSAFKEPTRHFKFSDEGITDEILDDRRPSSYFVPIARPKKKNPQQLSFDTEWTKDRIEENKLVNQIRDRIKPWRKAGLRRCSVYYNAKKIKSIWNTGMWRQNNMPNALDRLTIKGFKSIHTLENFELTNLMFLLVGTEPAKQLHWLFRLLRAIMDDTLNEFIRNGGGISDFLFNRTQSYIPAWIWMFFGQRGYRFHIIRA